MASCTGEPGDGEVLDGGADAAYFDGAARDVSMPIAGPERDERPDPDEISARIGGQPRELLCDDGKDDDRDGVIDCADADCAPSIHCTIACPAGSSLLTITATGTPIALPDGASTYIDLSVVTAADVSRAGARLSITHPRVRDLALVLYSPSGSAIDLSSGNGGTGANYFSTVFDDSARSYIFDAVTPYTGTFRPEAPLSATAGQAAGGLWSLEVTDLVAGMSGNLTDFRLYLCVCTNCETGTECSDGLDNDADGVTDCADGDCSYAPEMPDLCNGVDDDCDPASADGSEDPTMGVACGGPDIGVCPQAVTTCVAGTWFCDGTRLPSDRCNSRDDDCDPASADGSEDPLSDTMCDGVDGDLCLEGTRVCVAGVLTCTDGTGTASDVCNGLDDDCDTVSPDGSEDPMLGMACDGADTDLCREGVWTCSGGALVCSDTTASALDLCNGLDDDCNPATPDGSGAPGGGVACDGPDADLCTEGTMLCTGGASVCSDTTGSAADLCNGVDDDCNPATADGSADPGLGAACDGPDADLCAEGTHVCTAGALTCSDGTGSALDICNGLDDDCDSASADGSEDPGFGVACDGADSDLCAEGTRVCTAGALTCNDTSASAFDLCNGLNDDCDAASADGSEDPGFGVACDGADSDLCAEGTRVCTAGALTCNDPTASTLDLCNGLDDDCDPASTDGTEDPGFGIACDGADSDLCAEGTRICTAGTLACNDATGSALDLCNGLNDDCDPASADGTEDPGFGVACDGADSD
ncbi:MAG: hypothetical protein EXR73_10995, partial [Myxococcales bacterium]|nr:hypothetical protein [Myxococcales bacterium]